jgi:peptide chain release factor 1
MEGRLDLILEPLLNEFQKRQLTGEITKWHMRNS